MFHHPLWYELKKIEHQKTIFSPVRKDEEGKTIYKLRKKGKESAKFCLIDDFQPNMDLYDKINDYLEGDIGVHSIAKILTKLAAGTSGKLKDAFSAFDLGSESISTIRKKELYLRPGDKLYRWQKLIRDNGKFFNWTVYVIWDPYRKEKWIFIGDESEILFVE